MRAPPSADAAIGPAPLLNQDDCKVPSPLRAYPKNQRKFA